MKLTLLVSALNQNTDELMLKMNIASDVVIVNQCDEDRKEEFLDDYRVRILYSKKRGVGESRNLCIKNAFGDICLFSDDDIVYEDSYVKKVVDEFEAHPEADMIMFNVEVCEERRTYVNDRFKKLSKMNIGRYPAYSIAVRTKVLKEKELSFSTLFGGGAKYSNGEDSLFLRQAYEKGVKMYASPVYIAKEVPRQSTWFSGYTEKFFFDRGVLFYYLYKSKAWIWNTRFVLTKKDMLKGEIKRLEAFKLINSGIKEGKKLYEAGEY